MKNEYDLSKGERGKFYNPNVELNLPIYLDKDVASFLHKMSKKKEIDYQTAVNRLLTELTQKAI
jgi:hypothetical protein